jgi:hypothetical protein
LAKPQAATKVNLQVASLIKVEDADPVDVRGRPLLIDLDNGSDW